MVAGKQRHTFISYSRINKAFALKLAKELKAAGFPVWLDQLDIPAGSRWDDEIEKALRDCGIFLTILTPASIASENAKDEIGYAIDHGKRILPVLLEECDIPLRLRRFQYVDFTSMNYDQGVATAKDLLSRLIKEESIPVQKRTPQTKERPTRPAINISEQSKPGYKKIVPTEPVKNDSGRAAAKPWVIYAGIAVILLLALIGGAGFLGGMFSGTSPTSTFAPTPSSTPTSAPASTILADTPTSEAQIFYVEEFEDANLDSWEFLKQSGKSESEFDYAASDGKLVVRINPEQDEPSAQLINTAVDYGDVQLEVVVKNNGNNANGVSLICRYNERGWFEFMISNDQTYAIFVRAADGEILQGGSAGSPDIRIGQSENTYTASCKGNELSLHINGKSVRSLVTNHNFAEGKIGIGFSAPRNLPVDLEFESLKISQP